MKPLLKYTYMMASWQHSSVQRRVSTFFNGSDITYHSEPVLGQLMSYIIRRK